MRAEVLIGWARRYWVLFALLVLILGCGAMVWYQAPAHPDEHYQVFEPAHAWNYPSQFYVTWEWERGMRSWTLPIVMGWGNRVLESLGLRAQDKIFIWRLGFFILHILALLSLATIFPEAKQRGLYVFLIFSSWAIYYFGTRFLGDAVSMTAVLPACALLLPGLLYGRPWKTSFLIIAGVLLGIAFSIRFQTLLFAGGLSLALLYVYRSLRPLGWFLGSYLVIIGLQGVVDWITWGGFLHSFFEYVRANVWENKAATFGVTSWNDSLTFYFRLLTAIVALVLIPAWVRGFRQHKVLLWLVAPFFLVHAISLHKEIRFFYPLVPLVYVAVVMGWSAYRRIPKTKLIGFCFVALVVISNVVQFFFYSFHGVKNEQHYRDVFELSQTLPKDSRVKVFPPWGHFSYFDRSDVTQNFPSREVLVDELTQNPQMGTYYFVFKETKPMSIPPKCQRREFRLSWLVWCDEAMAKL